LNLDIESEELNEYVRESIEEANELDKDVQNM